MFKTERHLQIEWGDCDPAGIVFYHAILRFLTRPLPRCLRHLATRFITFGMS